ncbi:hypothetical protein [Enterococcus asini]|uniref:hypothetical protein n=1 Tax=Enterococcus asini TaxID=57732 RepID=UPI0022DF42C6|nr:hypothetical protein [Enterococcus asini]
MGIFIIIAFTIFVVFMLVTNSDGAEKREQDYFERTFKKKFPDRDISKAKIICTINVHTGLFRLEKNDYVYVDFDDEKKTVTVASDKNGEENTRTFAYQDILNYEVIQDGKSTFSPSITGFIGMRAAAPRHESKKISDWRISIHLNDFQNPVVNIILVNKECEIKSDAGFDKKTKKAEELLSTLAYATSQK